MAGGSLIQVATDLKSAQPQVGQVVMPGDNGLEKAASTVADSIAEVGNRIGKMADHAAQSEGLEAGRLAGMDPEFRPTHNRTLRGDAYDAAGLQVAGARVKTELAQDLATTAEKFPADPNKLQEALNAKADAWRKQAIPELLPEIEQEIQSRTFTHVREAAREHDHRLVQHQAAAVQTQVHETMRQISQEAYAGGLDPAAIENLNKRYAQLERMTQATGLRGQPLIAPEARVKLLEHAKQEMATSQTFGAYDRLPDLTAKDAFIKEFRQNFADGKGTSAAYDFAHFQRIEHGLQAQYTKDKTAAGVGLEMVAAKVKAVSSDLEAGYPIAPDRMAGINAQITMLGATAKNEKLTEQLAQAQVNGAMVQRLQVLPPDEQAAHVAQLRAEAQARGASEGDTHAIAIADKLLANTRAGIKADPLGWATKTGLYKVPALDLDPRRNDIAQQLQQRVAIAESIGQHYKLHLPGEAPADGTAATAGMDAPKVQYFTPDERQMLGGLMAQGGKATLLVAQTLAQSPRAPELLADLGKHAPTMALVGKLVADAPGAPPQVAIDAANGFGLLKTPDYKPRRGKAEDLRSAADSVIGTALTALPKTETAVVELANAAYEVRAHQLGKKDFDPTLWKQTLSEALGEKEVAGQKYGGLYYQGSGWLGGGKSAIVLPANIRQGAFDTLRRSIKVTDLDEAPQMETATAAMRDQPTVKSRADVSPADFQRATLKTAGDGKYFLALGDPDGADPKFLLDKTGAKYVLDLKKLEPKLRDRVPSAFLGGL